MSHSPHHDEWHVVGQRRYKAPQRQTTVAYNATKDNVKGIESSSSSINNNIDTNNRSNNTNSNNKNKHLAETEPELIIPHKQDDKGIYSATISFPAILSNVLLSHVALKTPFPEPTIGGTIHYTLKQPSLELLTTEYSHYMRILNNARQLIPYTHYFGIPWGPINPIVMDIHTDKDIDTTIIHPPSVVLPTHKDNAVNTSLHRFADRCTQSENTEQLVTNVVSLWRALGLRVDGRNKIDYPIDRDHDQSILLSKYESIIANKDLYTSLLGYSAMPLPKLHTTLLLCRILSRDEYDNVIKMLILPVHALPDDPNTKVTLSEYIQMVILPNPTTREEFEQQQEDHKQKVSSSNKHSNPENDGNDDDNNNPNNNNNKQHEPPQSLLTTKRKQRYSPSIPLIMRSSPLQYWGLDQNRDACAHAVLPITEAHVQNQTSSDGKPSPIEHLPNSKSPHIDRIVGYLSYCLLQNHLLSADEIKKEKYGNRYGYNTQVKYHMTLFNCKYSCNPHFKLLKSKFINAIDSLQKNNKTNSLIFMPPTRAPCINLYRMGSKYKLPPEIMSSSYSSSFASGKHLPRRHTVQEHYIVDGTVPLP